MEPESRVISPYIKDKATDIGQTISDNMQELLSTIDQRKCDLQEMAYVASVGSLMALHINSAFYGNPPEGNRSPQARVNPVSLLFAGILAAKMGSKVELKGPNTAAITCEWSTELLLDTLHATERVLGRKPDADLDPRLIEFLRGYETTRGKQYQLTHSTMQ